MKLAVLIAVLCASCTAITLAPERPKPQLQRANKVLAFRGGLSDKNQAIQDILKPSIDAQAEKQARSMKEYEKSSPLVGVITLDDAKYACPDVAPMRAPPHHHRLGTTWKLHDMMSGAGTATTIFTRRIRSSGRWATLTIATLTGRSVTGAHVHTCTHTPCLRHALSTPFVVASRCICRICASPFLRATFAAHVPPMCSLHVPIIIFFVSVMCQSAQERPLIY